MDEPDPQIVAAARSGDATAFESLVRRYQGDLWRLCFSLLGDRDRADDATQDAFVRAFRFLPAYRGDSKFSTWLFTIGRNCAYDEIRRTIRRTNAGRRLLEQPADNEPDQGVALEVRDMLAELPRDLREAVVLIDMFGISYAEAGRILDAPTGTIKSRVHRARSLLARRWVRNERETTSNES